MKKYLLWVVLLILVSSAGAAYYFVAYNSNNLDQRRIMLLEDALAPRTAEGAAYSWADAVKARNGAWQYALMDPGLRVQYRKEFEDNNWVTGFSSPWVQKYRVTRESVDDKGNVTFQVKFDWYTSAGYAYSNIATLIVSQYFKGEVNERWLISYLDFAYEPEQ